MKIKDIDDWDHFKGDFKSKPVKKTEPTTDTVLAKMFNFYSYETFGIDLAKYALWNISPSFKLKWDNPIPEECIHEPIDVGFAKVKMACKKCDKDL